MKLIADDYCHALHAYLHTGDEERLAEISALASKAVAHEYPIEMVAELHQRALTALPVERRASVAASERSSACLAEFLMAFGLAYRERSEHTQALLRIDAQRQKLEALGQMAAGVAHEFNNLLQPVTGLSEVMLLQEPEGPTAEAFAAILECSRKAAAIVRHILTYVRQLTPQPGPIAFGATVMREVTFLQRTVGPGICLHCDVRTPGDEIIGDEGELAQVIYNLVRNAIDATSGRGTIDIVVDRDDEGSGRISVTDDGCGMDAAVLGHIFQPFFTTKPAGQGTGLGLAVSHGIVTAWGGRITAVSELGRGCTMTVTVPLHGAGAAEKVQSA